MLLFEIIKSGRGIINQITASPLLLRLDLKRDEKKNKNNGNSTLKIIMFYDSGPTKIIYIYASIDIPQSWSSLGGRKTRARFREGNYKKAVGWGTKHPL